MIRFGDNNLMRFVRFGANIKSPMLLLREGIFVFVKSDIVIVVCQYIISSASESVASSVRSAVSCVLSIVNRLESELRFIDRRRQSTVHS